MRPPTRGAAPGSPAHRTPASPKPALTRTGGGSSGGSSAGSSGGSSGGSAGAAPSTRRITVYDTRWYGVVWPDGRFGYLSEVWINASDRGGLGLPSC